MHEELCYHERVQSLVHVEAHTCVEEPMQQRSSIAMASSTRKLTLLSCILKQPSPQKEVLLQAFTGVQLEDCAGRNSMSRSEVMDICRDFAEHAPELEEDRYEMAYHASKDRYDFCQTTGQNEGVFLYMELRYGKKKPVVSQSAVSVAAQPADRPVTPQPKKKRASRRKGTSASKDEPAQAAAPAPAPAPRVLTEEEKAAAELRRQQRRALRERDKGSWY